MKKILGVVLVMCFMLLNLSSVDAASASCNISGNTTVTVGSTVKVTVKISGSHMYMIQGSISSSNSGVLSGSGVLYRKADLSNPSETNGFSSASTSVTFTAKSVGKSVISFSQNINNCLDVNDQNISISGGDLTINVVEKSQNVPSNSTSISDTRSKENGLSDLSVSDGTLSPGFSSNVTKYTVDLGGEKTKINISAKSKDSKAKVSGTGQKELTVGKNSFVIKCQAENGSVKEYTIVVNVDEKPIVYLEFNNQKLGVVRNLDGVGTPTGFEKTIINIDGQEVDGWINKNIDMTIAYFVDDQGGKAFYVIENGKISFKFESVTIDERTFYILPIEDKMKQRIGFEFKKIKIIEGIELDGWIYNDEAFKDYIQVYLMNDQGKKHIYDYETTEGQLQIYTEQVQKSEGINIFMITTGVFVLTSAGLLYLYLSFKKKSISAIKEYYQNKD
ncbi:MAG: oxidoreductase [Coprobacillus sp.]